MSSILDGQFLMFKNARGYPCLRMPDVDGRNNTESQGLGLKSELRLPERVDVDIRAV